MENEKIELTELSELGEFGLIDRLTKDIKIHNKSTVKALATTPLSSIIKASRH